MENTNNENDHQLPTNSDSSQPLQEPHQFDGEQAACHAINIFIPVTICMLIVIYIANAITYFTTKDVYLPYTPFHETSPEASSKVWDAIANTSILVTAIIVMTAFMIFLYTQKCYKFINVWLMVSSFTMLSTFGMLFFSLWLSSLRVPMDIITMAVFQFNFTVAGMLCIHYQGPQRLTQAYLIFVSAVMGLFFIKYLPDWTTWAALFGISVWDLVAVMHPYGPLRILVETAEERNEPIFPSLIYSAMAYKDTAHQKNSSDSSELSSVSSSGRNDDNVDQDNSAHSEADTLQSISSHSSPQAHIMNPMIDVNLQRSPTISVPAGESSGATPQSEREIMMEPLRLPLQDRGVKLGLGDFVFYSVLVGKASTYGHAATTIACFMAVHIGLSLTLILLVVKNRALPALPISIMLGLVFYIFGNLFIQPYTDSLLQNQIFV